MQLRIIKSDQGSINGGGNYVDIGINSSKYNQGFIGNANDGYDYFTGSASGNNYYVGNATPGGNLYFFAGGSSNTASIQIDVNGAITASSLIANAYILTSTSINTQTGNYTLSGSDNGKFIAMTSGSTSFLTIPSGLPTGFSARFIQSGSGAVVVTGSGGVIIKNRAGLSQSYAPYSEGAVFNYGPFYSLGGDLA